MALQQDMELVGVVDAAPTLTVQALRDRGMPYKLFAAYDDACAPLEAAGVPVAGTMDEILPEVDVVLDAAPGGIGAKNKELYIKHGNKAVFPGRRERRGRRRLLPWIRQLREGPERPIPEADVVQHYRAYPDRRLS